MLVVTILLGGLFARGSDLESGYQCLFALNKVRSGGVLWTAPRNAVFFESENRRRDRLLLLSKKTIHVCALPSPDRFNEGLTQARYFKHRALKKHLLRVIDPSPSERQKPKTSHLPKLVLKKKQSAQPLTCKRFKNTRPQVFDEWLKKEILESSTELNPLTRVKQREYLKRFHAMKVCGKIYPELEMSFEDDSPEPMRLITLTEKYRFQRPLRAERAIASETPQGSTPVPQQIDNGQR